MRSSLAPSRKALRRNRGLERLPSLSLCGPSPLLRCVISNSIVVAWCSQLKDLNLPFTWGMGMASKTKGSTFQAVARRCGYLTKLKLPFLCSLLANPFRAAASLTPSQRAKCSRQHRELYPADTSAFTQHFSRVPQGMLAAEEEAAASS